jgi:hypothetical protein
MCALQCAVLCCVLCCVLMCSAEGMRWDGRGGEGRGCADVMCDCVRSLFKEFYRLLALRRDFDSLRTLIDLTHRREKIKLRLMRNEFDLCCQLWREVEIR